LELLLFTCFLYPYLFDEDGFLPLSEDGVDGGDRTGEERGDRKDLEDLEEGEVVVLLLNFSFV